MDKSYDSLIESYVDLSAVEDKTFEQLVYLFDKIITSLFDDGQYGLMRIIVIGVFGVAIVERLLNIDKNLLWETIKDRILLEYDNAIRYRT